MKKQHQTTFGGLDAVPEERGNCFSTCIACLLGIDTALVPNFCGLYGEREWMVQANRWLSEKGLLLVHFQGADPLASIPEYQEHATMIASGLSPRGHKHSVLWRNGKLLHDPHPSGAGLVEVPTEFELVVVSDLEKLESFFVSGYDPCLYSYQTGLHD